MGEPERSAPLFSRVVIHGLVKLFGPTRALAGVDLTLEAGAVAAIEGPNGAGKSTLLAILSTLARPTTGSVKYGPYDARDDLDLVRPAIGLLAHEAMVYPDLTPRESLRLYADLYDLPDKTAVVESALQRNALTEFAQRPARTLSRGQMQRLALARTLLPSPTLLLLDEPTTGLDVASVDRLAAMTKQWREDGRIVVLVTHDTGFADRVADRRVRIERGRVVSA